jgi:hypothetical protein
MKTETEKKIDAILDEREQMRDEIILFSKTILSFGPLLLTILSTAFVASLSEDVPAIIKNNRGCPLPLHCSPRKETEPAIWRSRIFVGVLVFNNEKILLSVSECNSLLDD